MSSENQFNQFAAEEFAREYELETGRRLRFKHVGADFPDAKFESNGSDIGVEFVSVVLSYVNVEQDDFRIYQKRFCEVLAIDRPRYKDYEIKLQPTVSRTDGSRPARLPRKRSPMREQLITEFGALLSAHFDQLSSAGASLLAHLRDASGALTFPVLTEYFDAIILNRGIGDDDSRKHRADDPVIVTSAVMYRSADVLQAVERALKLKASKGTAYSTEILLLHALPQDGKPSSSAVGFHAEQIVAWGRSLANDRCLRDRFDEIWFLNVYYVNGHRLFPLKVATKAMEIRS